jgi:ParB family chromosome partitioning protein
MDNHETKPSLSQAVRLKKLAQAGELTQDMIGEILSEVKKAPKEEKEGEGDKDDKDDSDDMEHKGLSQFRDYFPDGFTFIQMSEIITGLLQKWQVTSDTGLGIDGVAS